MEVKLLKNNEWYGLTLYSLQWISHGREYLPVCAIG